MIAPIPKKETHCKSIRGSCQNGTPPTPPPSNTLFYSSSAQFNCCCQ